MDWKYSRNVPLPFFMTYPGYLGGVREKELLADLEYLQQTYPNEVKRYQRRIAEILDKYDYEGSMIYDEYPDRYSLLRMTDTILAILKQEDAKLPPQERTPEEKWSWILGMIQVLLCNEIYKRRHGGRRGILKF